MTLLATRASAATEKVLHNFGASATDGVNPLAGLVIDEDGNLFGTTCYGGTHGGGGTVFELTPKEDGFWTEKVLHSFGHGDSGSYPSAGMIFDRSGNLYGTTENGGAHGVGTVFELKPVAGGKWTETVLHSFKEGADGGYPNDPGSGLIFDKSGNLFGTTENGGPYDEGTVFEIDTAGQETVLHTFFQNTDGGYPFAAPIFDAAGNIYSTTSIGGDRGNGTGTVYELTPGEGGGWTETELHSFIYNGTDGTQPQSGVAFDAAGNLYGTTDRGGAYGVGMVYELTPKQGGGWEEKILHSFGHEYPGETYGVFGGVLFDTKGNLYGTTISGGINGGGRVFELKPMGDGSWEYTVLHDFGKGTDGFDIEGALIIDAAGNLYGTTILGGTHGMGTVFEIIP